MKIKPKISVLMPVYNREDFVAEAIESILAQTYTNFEFIIVNDGSTDNTKKIVEKYAQSDSRIKVIHNITNLGLIHSLTLGLQYIQGEYIARMDSDDISLPERFEKQLSYMESHPEIGILGCGFRWIDSDGKTFLPKTQRARNSDLIWWNMFFFPEVGHPMILARRDVYGRFNENNLEVDFIHAEDHAFWLRIGFETRFENLPDVLFYFRSHKGRITSSSNLIQKHSDEKAIQRGLFIALSKEVSLEAIQSFKDMKMDQSMHVAKEAIHILFDLYKWFCQLYSVSDEDLSLIRRGLEYRYIRYITGYLRKDFRVSLISAGKFLQLLKPKADLFYWSNIGIKKLFRKNNQVSRKIE